VFSRQIGMDYEYEKRKIQELPGCAGGGKQVNVLSSGVSRKGSYQLNQASDDYEF